MIFNMVGKSGGSSFVAGADVILAHSVTGGMTDHGMVTMADGKSYRLFEITQSGTLTFDSTQVAKGILADIWMCGGGNSGHSAYTSGDYRYSGKGGAGAGAYLLFGKIITEATMTVSIGSGGAAPTTTTSSSVNYGGASVLTMGLLKLTTPISDTTFGYSETNGTGAGGNGHFTGGHSAYSIGSRGSGDGIANKRPFNDTYLPLCCSGGGGGTCMYGTPYHITGGAGGENGANGSEGVYSQDYSYVGGVGGSGAGNGGSNSSITGTDATTYGSGGGGGAYSSSDSYGYGGAGKQGVVYIRIAA